MKKTVTIAAVAALAMITLAGPASATTPTDCTGTLGAETVGPLNVPDGERCKLAGTTVEGDVTIGTGSTLASRGAKITGGVTGVEGPHRVRLLETDIGLSVWIIGATGRITMGSRDCNIDPSVGDSVTLSKNLRGIALCDLDIWKNLTLTANVGRISVLGNLVGNDFRVYNSDGVAFRARDNQVGRGSSGDLVLTGNTFAKVLILSRNHAVNRIFCDGNTPDPTGSGNTADGDGLQGQCAGLG